MILIGWAGLVNGFFDRRRIIVDASQNRVRFYRRTLRTFIDCSLPLEEAVGCKVAHSRRVYTGTHGTSKTPYFNYLFKLMLADGRNIKLFETGSMGQANQFDKLFAELTDKPFEKTVAASVPDYLQNGTLFLRPAGAHGQYDPAGTVCFEAMDNVVTGSMSGRGRSYSVL